MKIGIFGLTFIVLLILKLTGAASISWVVVFSPFIVAVILFAGIFLLGVACGVISELL